ncbi:hypothetical protein SELMODRAFT_71798, partial [Selaginella moellendorffii]
SVQTCILSFYGKHGNIRDARSLFEALETRNSVCWNAIIGIYAQHGFGEEAMALYQRMKAEKGLKMDDITFVIILSVCSHLGLLREGRDLFVSLQQDFGIHYLSEHYGCVVDLLARAGMLDVAEEFLERLPAMQFSPVHWTSLLTSCRAHGDVERGTRAAMLLFELDPQDSGTYAILEQLYTNAGRWDDLAELAKIM